MLPTIGMPADQVLRLPGYGRDDASRPPQPLSRGENGIIIRWHYPDLDLILARDRGCYRVQALVPRA